MMAILMLIVGSMVVSSAVFAFALARVAARAETWMEEALAVQALQDQRSDILSQGHDAPLATLPQPMITTMQPYDPTPAEDIVLSYR